MKKLNFIQIVLLTITTLIVGLLVGFMIDLPIFSKEELSGSIGKVDRYRNVKMTDQDILLRNELVDDTNKCIQYQKYLMFYYYQSVKTSYDVEKVLTLTTKVPEFFRTYYPYAEALSSFKVYLEPAREDILLAYNMISSLESDAEVPVMRYLNEAINAIARIKNHDAILVNYMTAIETFIQSSSDTTYPTLMDAHDLLSFNIIQTAVLTQNKPVLEYLNKKKLMNNKEGLKEIVADAGLKLYVKEQYATDVNKLGFVVSDRFDDAFGDIGQYLNSDVLLSSRLLNEINLGSDGLFDFFDLFHSQSIGIYQSEQTLGYLVGDMGTLEGFSPIK